MFRRFAWLPAAALLVSACGSAAPASHSAGGKGKKLTHISFALAANVLAFAPLFVAEQEGFYKQKGIDLSVHSLGGSASIQAVNSGSVQFSADDSGTIGIATSKGAHVQAIETLMNKVTLNLALSNAVVQRDHLTRSMPLQQRLKALKGLRLGLVSPAGAVAIFTRYLVQQAGYTEGKQVKTVVIGAVPLLIAAMQKGEIDGFMSSPPGPEEAQALGIGKVIIASSEGDVPSLSNFTYESIVTSPKYAKAHPNIVRAMAQATAMGNNLIRKNPAKALADIEKHFPHVKKSLLKTAMHDISTAVPANGLGSEKDWAHALQIEKQVKMVKGSISPKQGVLWTNKYVQGVNGAD